MIYLDHNATSPLRPEALDAMRPWLGRPANPASVHRAGQAAAAAVEEARVEVAALVGRDPAGVVFTSGATEANHTWIAALPRLGVTRIAASAVEHPCVQAALARLEAQGVRVDRLPVGPDGVARLDGLAPGVEAITLMAANHETGVLQPVDAAARIAAERCAWLHVDAVQAAGRVPLALADAHAVTLSSHKLGGPAGVGALLLPDGEAFPALLTGGAQERGRRAGTVNVAGVVGFAAACRAAREQLEAEGARLGALSERLRDGLIALGARLVGDRARLLPTTTCAVFPGLRGESLVQALDLQGIAVSSGAACASGSLEPSPVLLAMADPEPDGGLRISLGHSTRQGDVEALLEVFPGVLAGVREAAAWES